jgi:hypothetical protein
MSAREKTAVLLEKSFDSKSLASGDYIVASNTEAYVIVMAMIADGDAKWLGERQAPGGVLLSLVRVRSKVKNSLRPNRDVYVTYSADAFVKILRDYSNWQEKWWRECIQNAVDAGATEIKLSAHPTARNTMICSCEDNGKGMTEDILENKFLKLGGSTKDTADSETAGGFGEAKKLLILPWLNWMIVTNDVMAKGVADKGDIGAAPKPIKGTVLQVEMTADECTDYVAAMSYVKKCYLPNVKFTINGDEVKAEFLPGKFAFKVGRKATVSHNQFSGVSSIMVRAKGLFMFENSLLGVEGTVVVELNRPSIELLTSNRDGFRDDELSSAIDTFKSQVSKDTYSALHEKTQSEKHKFKGIGNPRNHERVLSVLAAMPPLPAIEPGQHVAFDPKLIGPVVKQFEVTDAVNDLGLCEGVAKVILTSISVASQTKLERVINTMVWNPDILIANERKDVEIPSIFFPDTMTEPVKRLLRVWSELCRYVLIQLGCTDPFNVGFVLSDRASAMLMRWAGADYLLLNPLDAARVDGVWEPSKTEDLRWLYALAVHEATHMADNIIYHDETFSSAVTRNMAKCTDGFCHAEAIVRAIDKAERRAATRGVSGEQLELKFATPEATRLFELLHKRLVKRLDEVGAEPDVYESHSEKLGKLIQAMDISAPAVFILDIPLAAQGQSVQAIEDTIDAAVDGYDKYQVRDMVKIGWDGQRAVELRDAESVNIFVQRHWQSVEIAEELGLPPNAEWSDAHQTLHKELSELTRPGGMSKLAFKQLLAREIVAIDANEPTLALIGSRDLVVFQHSDRDEMEKLFDYHRKHITYANVYGWTGGESGDLKPLDSRGDVSFFLAKHWKFSTKELTDLLAHRLSQVNGLPDMSAQQWEDETEKMAKAIRVKDPALFLRSDTRADLFQFNTVSEMEDRLESLYRSTGANAELYGWEPVEGKVDGYLYELSQTRDYEAFLKKHWEAPPKPRKNMPHYNALLAESERIGWPTRHKRDLVEIDREMLESYPPHLPFLWMVREGGTYLCTIKEKPNTDKAHEVALNVGITTKERKDSEHLWYGWDGQGKLWRIQDEEELDSFLKVFWPKT